MPPQGTPEERSRDPAAFTPPPAPVSGEMHVVDQTAIDKLNAVWRGLSADQRTATHGQYLEELAEFYSGRTLAEGRGNFLARIGRRAKYE